MVFPAALAFSTKKRHDFASTRAKITIPGNTKLQIQNTIIQNTTDCLRNQTNKKIITLLSRILHVTFSTPVTINKGKSLIMLTFLKKMSMLVEPLLGALTQRRCAPPLRCTLKRHLNVTSQPWIEVPLSSIPLQPHLRAFHNIAIQWVTLQPHLRDIYDIAAHFLTLQPHLRSLDTLSVTLQTHLKLFTILRDRPHLVNLEGIPFTIWN